MPRKRRLRVSSLSRRNRQIKGSFSQWQILESSGTRFSSRIPFQVAAGERHRGLARATPDLEYAPPSLYPGERDDVVEEILRKTRTHLVVERRCLIEGRPEPVPLLGHELALTDVPQ
jgi:hypothetical protein